MGQKNWRGCDLCMVVKCQDSRIALAAWDYEVRERSLPRSSYEVATEQEKLIQDIYLGQQHT